MSCAYTDKDKDDGYHDHTSNYQHSDVRLFAWKSPIPFPLLTRTNPLNIVIGTNENLRDSLGILVIPETTRNVQGIIHTLPMGRSQTPPEIK
jgi:hypothetical protein